jgi:hypothetical protein
MSDASDGLVGRIAISKDRDGFGFQNKPDTLTEAGVVARELPYRR